MLSLSHSLSPALRRLRLRRPIFPHLPLRLQHLAAARRNEANDLNTDIEHADDDVAPPAATEDDLLADAELDEYQAKQLHAIEAAQKAFARRRHYKQVSDPIRRFTRVVEEGDIPLGRDFAQTVDHTLKELRWSKGRGHQYKETAYHLWHTAFRLPLEYSVLRRIFSELKKRLPRQRLNSVLDYGSQTGATVWALHDVYHAEALKPAANNNTDPSSKLGQIICVEQSPQLRDTHQRMTGQLPLNIQRTARYFLEDNVQRRASEKTQSKMDHRKRSNNLTVCAYTLSRLDADQRHRVLDQLWNSTAETLVLVEHGDSEGFQVIADARQHMISTHGKMNAKKSGDMKNVAVCLAPCAHDRPCPMLNPKFNPPALNRYCNFGERIIPSSLPIKSPARHIPHTGDGKALIHNFSYVVFHRGVLNQQNDVPMVNDAVLAEAYGLSPDQQLSVKPDSFHLDLHQPKEENEEDNEAEDVVEGENSSLEISAEAESSDVAEDQQINNDDDAVDTVSKLPGVFPSAFYPHQYNRIISPPMRRGRHVVLDLCNTAGQLERRIIPKSHGLHYGYEQAKYSKWGDLWQFLRIPSLTDRRKAEAQAAGSEYVRPSKTQEAVDRRKLMKEKHKPRGTGNAPQPQWLQTVNETAAPGPLTMTQHQQMAVDSAKEKYYQSKAKVGSFWNAHTATDAKKPKREIIDIRIDDDTSGNKVEDYMMSEEKVQLRKNRQRRNKMKQQKTANQSSDWKGTNDDTSKKPLTREQVDLLLSQSNLHKTRQANSNQQATPISITKAVKRQQAKE